MDEYFYQVFCHEVLKENDDAKDQTKHRILLPVGKNCKPHYSVTYKYAKGILIQHKPWTKERPLTKLLKDRDRTIRTFKRMLDRSGFRQV